MEKVRIDKWLWSVRIFKSRSLATRMCKAGKIRLGEDKVKASQMIAVDDHIKVSKNGYEFTFRVIKLLDKRVGAPIAVTAYEDLTPESELRKYDDWFVGKASPETREKGTGRPTKKQRRTIDQFKRDFYFSD